LTEELEQFAALFNAILDKQKANLDHRDGKCIQFRMYLFILANELYSSFPNTEIALYLYLCVMVSNCTGERSSKLCRINNHFRSSVGKEKLSMLSLISSEHEILGDEHLETIINDFMCKKWVDMKLFVAEFLQKPQLVQLIHLFMWPTY